MIWETVFQAANLLALGGWIILVAAPRRAAALQAIPGYIVPVILSAAYFVLVAVYFARAEGGYSSLEEVGALFASEPVLLAGWLHYLAFDLFVGEWITRQSDMLGISRALQVPILLATFLFGPVGLLLFMALRIAVSPRQPAATGMEL